MTSSTGARRYPIGPWVYLGGRVQGAWNTEAGYVLARMRYLLGQAYDPRAMADWNLTEDRRRKLDRVAQNLIDCARRTP